MGPPQVPKEYISITIFIAVSEEIVGELEWEGLADAIDPEVAAAEDDTRGNIVRTVDMNKGKGCHQAVHGSAGQAIVPLV